MKKSVPPPSLDQLLDAVPVCNGAVRVEKRESNVILWVPIQRHWWMEGPISWFLPIRREKGVALDVIGSEVWSACDGKRRVEDIIEGFAQRHKLRFHESRASVMQFLKSLLERKLLVLALPGSGSESAANVVQAGRAP